MLNAIESYVTQFTEMIATVTGIDVEVVDTNLVRVAGTGIHAAGVGRSLETAGELYSHSLVHKETVFVADPKENFLCQKCPDIRNCREKLTMCAPIVIGGDIAGIIGLLCYNNNDRDRVLKNRETYVYFIQQMADAIARVAESEQDARKTRRRLDMLLRMTDSNTNCVLVLDAEERVSFINDTARQELGIEGRDGDYAVAISGTGDVYSDMDEFELVVTRAGGGAAESRHSVLGKLSTLEDNDPSFARGLVFTSKQSLTEMVSQLGSASDNTDVLNSIIGNSAIMKSLKKRVMRIADTSSTVLISGESGTGKEMFARAIHAASNRKDKPFVAINCGAIPDSLLESELFGYVKGAFTGANPSGRMGKFELADQGVLFLDEISSLPLYLQVKLLRILQERSFSRLGSNKTIEVDLRIIAATNESLPDLIKRRMFREDLYYRLNVIPLELPPLRERKGDVAILAEYFTALYCMRFGKPKAQLSPPVLERLNAYHWPGNVRELENCIEYMINMYEKGSLSTALLPAKLLGSIPPGSYSEAVRGALSAVGAGDASASAPVVPLDELEYGVILNTLARFEDSTKGKRLAAEALGISLATLYRKLKNG